MVVSALATVAVAAPTAAQSRAPVAIDAEIGAGRSLDSVGQDAFGPLGTASVGLEVNALSWLGIHVGAAGTYAFAGSSTSSAAWWIGGVAGLRLHWGTWVGPPQNDGWLDVHANYGESDGVARPGVDVGLGYAFALTPGVRIGPYVRYRWESDPRGADPQWLAGGVSLGFLGDPRTALHPASVADHDADGVPDGEDQCPTEPAGARPDPRRRGCPVRDADGDGVPDDGDVCPTQPAGAHPDPRRPGCPESDADGDGVSDASDECPTVPAGAHPSRTRRGCPDTDRDGDGVFDAADLCPDEPPGTHPDLSRPGCPLVDRDHDTVPDVSDHCPDQAGAPSLDPTRNGCPGLVRIQDGQIRLLSPVFFATRREVILDASFPVLMAALDAIRASSVERLRIEGYTDQLGHPQRNLALSQRRADRVREWLVGHGVPADHVVAVGYGSAHPVEDNATPLGRAANRRVEFHIVSVGSGAPVTP